MTVNQLIECALGKVCAFSGDYGDATPFTEYSTNVADKVCEQLEKIGFERHKKGKNCDTPLKDYKYGWEQMYNGFTGEPIKAKIFIGPTYYQRLKHMVGNKMHCLTMDHEVLTLYGWKFFHELSKNDKVATLVNGDTLEYVHPTNLFHYPDYKGKIYHIENQCVDLSVTDEHRMYVKLENSNKFELIMAKDIVGKQVEYKKNVEKYYEQKWSRKLVEEMVDNQNRHYHGTQVEINRFQQLCFHAGWSANITKEKNGGYSAFLIKESWKIKKNKETIEYKECPVFCISVPSEIFYVRRNGKCVWTGNSRARGRQTMLTRQPLEGRSRDGQTGHKAGSKIIVLIVNIGLKKRLYR